MRLFNYYYSEVTMYHQCVTDGFMILVCDSITNTIILLLNVTLEYAQRERPTVSHSYTPNPFQRYHSPKLAVCWQRFERRQKTLSRNSNSEAWSRGGDTHRNNKYLNTANSGSLVFLGELEGRSRLANSRQFNSALNVQASSKCAAVVNL